MVQTNILNYYTQYYINKTCQARIKILVSMIRKYHNHTLQTTLGRREEESQNINNNKTLERQLKQSKKLSRPRQDDR